MHGTHSKINPVYFIILRLKIKKIKKDETSKPKRPSPSKTSTSTSTNDYEHQLLLRHSLPTGRPRFSRKVKSQDMINFPRTSRKPSNKTKMQLESLTPQSSPNQTMPCAYHPINF